MTGRPGDTTACHGPPATPGCRHSSACRARPTHPASGIPQTGQRSRQDTMPHHPAGKSAGHPTPLPVESGPSGARGHHPPPPPRIPASRHLLRPGPASAASSSFSGPAPRQAEGRLRRSASRHRAGAKRADRADQRGRNERAELPHQSAGRKCGSGRQRIFAAERLVNTGEIA